MKKAVIFGMFIGLIVAAVWLGIQGQVHLQANNRFFDVQSIDTMKYSRDAAGDSSVTQQIPTLVEKVASLNPTHIAIGTPYDEEFYPILRTWVSEARKHHLKVWFRGNFSSWEGWFGYAKFQDPNQHHIKLKAFIAKHPELFEDGDIFTPAPEPENGGVGDPRKETETKQRFFDFLILSYKTCHESFQKINKNVQCGYFSMNGDVAKILTPDIIHQIGNRLIIDHYVKTPEELGAAIDGYYAEYGSKIVIGEFGAPIPDLQGDMTSEQQAGFIKNTLAEFIKRKDFVDGINYWTAFGGSTALFDGNLNPKPAAKLIASYYTPLQVQGRVLDGFGVPVYRATVHTSSFLTTKTQRDGTYSLLTTVDFPQVTVEKERFGRQTFTISSTDKSVIIVKNVTLSNQKRGFFSEVLLLFSSLFKHN